MPPEGYKKQMAANEQLAAKRAGRDPSPSKESGPGIQIKKGGLNYN
jgi:hypothetical protein